MSTSDIGIAVPIKEFFNYVEAANSDRDYWQNVKASFYGFLSTFNTCRRITSTSPLETRIQLISNAMNEYTSANNMYSQIKQAHSPFSIVSSDGTTVSDTYVLECLGAWQKGSKAELDRACRLAKGSSR